MKKILILNGSHSDIQLIKSAKELGYYVITSGNRPDLLGHQYADEYVYGDYSKPELMLEIAKSKRIDAVCSCANDFGAISAAYVSEKLELPGHDSLDATLTLHHKDKFKLFSKEHDIPTPIAEDYTDYYKALESITQIEYPVMVKPVDLTGGKGVTKVETKDQFEQALRKAFDISPSNHIVIEPFIAGTHHSFSTFLINRKVAAFYSDNEYSFASPFMVTTSAGPATDINLVKDELITVSEKIASILKLRDGVFHIQYILSAGKPYILEITRRCSGDFYSLPVEHSTGIPWAEWIVKSECGMDCNSFPRETKQAKYGGRHCIVGNRNGDICGIHISSTIKENIYDDFLWWDHTKRIDNHLIDKIGIVFLEFDSYDDMIYKTENITEYIYPVYV